MEPLTKLVGKTSDPNNYQSESFVSEVSPIQNKYKMITGKKRLIENFGNQKSYSYINDSGTKIIRG
jgi:hypothetical protein